MSRQPEGRLGWENTSPTDLLREVRRKKYAALVKGRGYEMLENTLVKWRSIHAKIKELDDWLGQAEKELGSNCSVKDPRMQVVGQVVAQRQKLYDQMEELELEQEEALKDILSRTGPTKVVREDGSTDVVSAGDYAGSLLPRDLLAVWRVAQVFDGKVVLDNEKPQWGKRVTELPKGKKEELVIDVGQRSFEV